MLMCFLLSYLDVLFVPTLTEFINFLANKVTIGQEDIHTINSVITTDYFLIGTKYINF